MAAPAHMPLQDIESERALLGGVLLDNEALIEVAELVQPQDFYRPAHGEIFRAMLALSERREPIDILTITDQLGAMQKDVGGRDYVNQLYAYVPTAAAITSYAKTVRDLARRRAVVAATLEVQRLMFSGEGGIDAIMDQAGHRILAAVEDRSVRGPEHVQMIARRVFTRIEERHDENREVTGTPTGFERLDRMTAGWQPGELIVLAGRPAMGKTALMMAMARTSALEKPTLVCELEMSADSLIERQLASDGRVPAFRLKTGKLVDTDWPKLARAAEALSKSNLFIVDCPSLTVMGARAIARRLQLKHGPLGAVFIDYLQLMHTPEVTVREQEVASISRGLKALARELGCPVIVLSQLNRSLERREEKRPVMSDLRESGAIEQDADVVVFVHREEVYDRETTDQGIAELIIGKQRNGATGTVKVKFIAELTRFERLDEGWN